MSGDGDRAPAGRVGSHWFEPLAETLGAAYLRYSFGRGTNHEVDRLVDLLAPHVGGRVLDVGCGPGRLSEPLAARGFEVVGVDISHRFLEVGNTAGGASYVRGDAARLPFAEHFDAVISVCQGAFGMAGGPGGSPVGHGPRWTDPDGEILTEMARVLRPGGSLVLTTFSAYFQVRWLETTDVFDADRGVNLEQTEIRDEQGGSHPASLWTSCFTPRELRLLAGRAGLEVLDIWSVEPGAWRSEPPSIERPEFMVVARRPELRS